MKYKLNNEIFDVDSLEELILKLYEGGVLLDNKTKIQISKFEERIPLYDIKSNKIYLIYRENVHNRIVYDHYRLLTHEIIEHLNNRMKIFIDQYDFDILESTYYKVFYASFISEKYITDCVRPSYKSGFSHIKPYYQRDELYYLSVDWNKKDNCQLVQRHDISSETLINHQECIFKEKSVCLVKYYSLFGSYLINDYTRNTKCCLDRPNPYSVNNVLEKQITLMMKLIKKAPPILSATNVDVSSYLRRSTINVSHEQANQTMYRLIETDEFMSHLKPGDIYTDPSFMSTTRNPFYYQNNYQFGYILIKITVPQKSGIGLCIESYSNFPAEEEVIFPPSSQFRLDNIILETPELDKVLLNKRVIKKYEMTYIGHNIDQVIDRLENKETNVTLPIINMEELKLNGISLAEKIEHLIDMTNENRQFRSMINNHEIIFTVGSYNSSTVYSPFFYYQETNGVMIYSSNLKYGNLSLLIEIGEELHCNYYFKYSINDTNQQFNLDTPHWIAWLSFLSHSLGVKTAIIHPNYAISYDKESVASTRFVHPINIYQYLSKGKKYFQEIEITPAFEYYFLDQLSNTHPDQILSFTDKDELFQIQSNLKLDNMKDFYIKIVDSYPQYRIALEQKFDKLFPSEENPFNHLWYRIECQTYLYNRNLISNIMTYAFKKGSFKKLLVHTKLRQFQNRLRYYLQN